MQMFIALLSRPADFSLHRILILKLIPIQWAYFHTCVCVYDLPKLSRLNIDSVAHEEQSIC